MGFFKPLFLLFPDICLFDWSQIGREKEVMLSEEVPLVPCPPLHTPAHGCSAEFSMAQTPLQLVASHTGNRLGTFLFSSSQWLRGTLISPVNGNRRR
jgi:hypothetical protein